MLYFPIQKVTYVYLQGFQRFEVQIGAKTQHNIVIF